MTRHFVIACLIYIALALQSSLSVGLTGDMIRLWLPGIALVAIILMIDGSARLIWAGFLGLCVDCLTIDRLGIHLVVVTTVATCLILVRDDARRPSLFQIGVLTIVGTFLWRCVAGTVMGILERRILAIEPIVVSPLIEAVSTTGLVAGTLLTVRFLAFFVKRRQTPSVVLGNQWSMLSGS